MTLLIGEPIWKKIRKPIYHLKRNKLKGLDVLHKIVEWFCHSNFKCFRVDSLHVEMAVALMPFGYIFVFPYNK